MTQLSVQRGYVSATVASNLLGVSRQRVNQLLTAGSLAGSFRMDIGDGREMWCIPRKSVLQYMNHRKQK